MLPLQSLAKHRDVYDDIEQLPDKPWRGVDADITDYFNYGFDEQSWRVYCRKQRRMRELASRARSQARNQHVASLPPSPPKPDDSPPPPPPRSSPPPPPPVESPRERKESLKIPENQGLSTRPTTERPDDSQQPPTPPRPQLPKASNSLDPRKSVAAVSPTTPTMHKRGGGGSKVCHFSRLSPTSPPETPPKPDNRHFKHRAHNASHKQHSPSRHTHCSGTYRPWRAGSAEYSPTPKTRGRNRTRHQKESNIPRQRHASNTAQIRHGDTHHHNRKKARDVRRPRHGGIGPQSSGETTGNSLSAGWDNSNPFTTQPHTSAPPRVYPAERRAPRSAQPPAASRHRHRNAVAPRSRAHSTHSPERHAALFPERAPPNWPALYPHEQGPPSPCVKKAPASRRHEHVVKREPKAELEEALHHTPQPSRHLNPPPHHTNARPSRDCTNVPTPQAPWEMSRSMLPPAYMSGVPPYPPFYMCHQHQQHYAVDPRLLDPRPPRRAPLLAYPNAPIYQARGWMIRGGQCEGRSCMRHARRAGPSWRAEGESTRVGRRGGRGGGEADASGTTRRGRVRKRQRTE